LFNYIVEYTYLYILPMYMYVMRILRSYTIETDYVDRMKNSGVNVSELLNKLLKNYFDDEDLIGATKEEIQHKLKLLDIEERYVKDKKLWEEEWKNLKNK
jgi:hypothetical protein